MSRHQGHIRIYNTPWIHNHRKISCSLIINKKSPSRWEITFIHSHIPITTKGVWKRKIIFKSHLLMLIIKVIFIWIPKKFKLYLMSYAMIYSKMRTNNGRQSNVIYIIGQHSWIITNKSRQKDAMILPPMMILLCTSRKYVLRTNSNLDIYFISIKPLALFANITSKMQNEFLENCNSDCLKYLLVCTPSYYNVFCSW